MTLNDPLANALSKIAQYEKLGRKEVMIRPGSKIIRAVLDIMHREGYLGTYEALGVGRTSHLNVNLLGQLNACGAIKPRFSVKLDGFEKREKQYLPAKGFGILIISTPQGLLTHHDAQKQGAGGRLIAFCY